MGVSRNKRQEVVNKIIAILEETDSNRAYPDLYRHIKEWIDEIPAKEEYDGDLISRQSALEAIKALPRWVMNVEGEFQPVELSAVSMLDPDDAISAIENLPSMGGRLTKMCEDNDGIYCEDCENNRVVSWCAKALSGSHGVDVKNYPVWMEGFWKGLEATERDNRYYDDEMDFLCYLEDIIGEEKIQKYRDDFTKSEGK